MFAASLETSDPEMFMAIPKSAYIGGDVSVYFQATSHNALTFFRAGESLTPSPVLPLDVSRTQHRRRPFAKLTLLRCGQEPERVSLCVTESTVRNDVG